MKLYAEKHTYNGDNGELPLCNIDIRKIGYKVFTYEKYGDLRKYACVKVPRCVEIGIRSLYPE